MTDRDPAAAAGTASQPHPDAITRAHLTGATAPSPRIARYDPAADLTELIQRFWVPVWDLPPGTTQTQKVLQHPSCLLVIASTYARFYGVVTGLSTIDLTGQGWAFGTMLSPAAGHLLWGRSVEQLSNTHVDLAELPSLGGPALTAAVTDLMTPDPHDPARHRQAARAVEDQLRRHLPVDDTGRLVNDIVRTVDAHPALARVEELADLVGLDVRTLQRLTREHLGLTPKWLLQRRRLHEAVGRLQGGGLTLTDLAHDLGYADQAHLTRDFVRFTGMTPSAYLADQRP